MVTSVRLSCYRGCWKTAELQLASYVQNSGKLCAVAAHSVRKHNSVNQTLLPSALDGIHAGVSLSNLHKSIHNTGVGIENCSWIIRNSDYDMHKYMLELNTN